MLKVRHTLLLLTPLAVLVCPLLVWPTFLGFLLSLMNYVPGQSDVHFVGLQNYVAILGDPQFRVALRNIAIYVLAAVPAELVVGLAIAHALRRPFRGRALVRTSLLLPWAISPIAAGVMWHFVYSRNLGLLNFVLAWLHVPPLPSPLSHGVALIAVIMVDVWRKGPLVSFLFLPGVLAIPGDRWEQARLDGVSSLGEIYQIILPGVWPLLFAVALLLIGDTLGTFESALMMTSGGPVNETLTPGLYSFKHGFQDYDWLAGVASVWIIVGCVLVAGLGYILLLRNNAEEGAGARNHDNTNGSPVQQRPPSRSQVVFLSIIFLAIVLPLIWTLLASFDVMPNQASTPLLLTWPPSTEAFAQVMVALPNFPLVLATSVGFATTSTLLAMGVAFPAAYGLARSGLRSKRVIVQSFLVFATLPAMAYVIPFYIIPGSDVTRYAHLYDTFPGTTLVLAAVSAPLAVYVISGYLSQVSPTIENAARLDGASLTQMLWLLVVPATAPELTATAVLMFVLNWNSFVVPMALLFQHTKPIPVALVDIFSYERELEWPTAAAALSISLLPVFALVALAYRAVQQFTLGQIRKD